MGCDIHMTFERQTPDGYVQVDVPDKFDDRCTPFFSWLAGIGRYRCPLLTVPLAKERGFPQDMGPVGWWVEDCHHDPSWVGLDELVAYPYQTEVREGETAQDMLGERYFEALEGWRACGVDRIVFWFDS